MHVFPTIAEAQQIWIKGHHFTLTSLLQNADLVRARPLLPSRISVGPPIDPHLSLPPVLHIPLQAKRYEGGSLVIARLAPQDYHRFHMPVGGTLRPFTPIDGTYFTVPSSPRPGLCAISSGRLTKYETYDLTQVNPVAVNTSVDVYTENKRVVCPIDSDEFGLVTFVAIGATMVRHHAYAHALVVNLLPTIASQVGSICFTTTPGQTIKKGDEHGYFGAHPPPPARHDRSVCACAVRT